MLCFNKIKSRQTITYFAISLFFLLTPLLSAILFCFKDGHFLNQVCIYLSGWSDEITYFKQIEGMVAYGSPKGFFGYDESRALIGPYSVWGVFPLIPYALFGKLFGWCFQSPIYANILLCTIALMTCILLIRPTKKQMLSFSIVWFTYHFLNRYILSAVVEAFFIAMLIFIFSCGIYLLSPKIRNSGRNLTPKKDILVVCLMTTAIFYVTICRPYYGVLFLLPLGKMLKDKKIWGCIALSILAVFNLVLFFVNNHYFCSTYYANMLDFAFISKGSILDSLKVIVTKLISGLQFVIRYSYYALRYKNTTGWYYIIFFICMTILLSHCIYRLIKHKPMSFMFIATLIGNTLILFSLFIIYEKTVSARHILSLNIAMIFIILMELHPLWSAAFSSLGILCTLLIGNVDAVSYSYPEYEAYFQNLRSCYESVITVSDQLSYENVVAMPVRDKSFENPDQAVGTYYGLLYATPAGVGISLDYPEIYENLNTVKAGYILCHPDGCIRKSLESYGRKCIYEDKDCVIFH